MWVHTHLLKSIRWVRNRLAEAGTYNLRSVCVPLVYNSRIFVLRKRTACVRITFGSRPACAFQRSFRALLALVTLPATAHSNIYNSGGVNGCYIEREVTRDRFAFVSLPVRVCFAPGPRLFRLHFAFVSLPVPARSNINVLTVGGVDGC